jgi:hypothetical protein
MNQIRKIPGAVDFRIQEPNNAPELDITMDRTKASILGINAQSVANSVLRALAGSQQNALNFWVDPKNGVSQTDRAICLGRDPNIPDCGCRFDSNSGDQRHTTGVEAVNSSRNVQFPSLDSVAQDRTCRF